MTLKLFFGGFIGNQILFCLEKDVIYENAEIGVSLHAHNELLSRFIDLHDFNINITVSNSDIFCDKNDSLKLAELLNAKVKEFDWTFHNPMHFPWSQKEFHDWLLESSQYGTE